LGVRHDRTSRQLEQFVFGLASPNLPDRRRFAKISKLPCLAFNQVSQWRQVDSRCPVGFLLAILSVTSRDSRVLLECSRILSGAFCRRDEDLPLAGNLLTMQGSTSQPGPYGVGAHAKHPGSLDHPDSRILSCRVGVLSGVGRCPVDHDTIIRGISQEQNHNRIYRAGFQGREVPFGICREFSAINLIPLSNVFFTVVPRLPS